MKSKLPIKKRKSRIDNIDKAQDTPKKATKVEASFYEGIIPSPEMMEHYYNIDSTLPSRILAMAEEEGNSRREINKRVLDHSVLLDVVSNV